MEEIKCEVCGGDDVVFGEKYCSMSCQDTLTFRSLGIPDPDELYPSMIKQRDVRCIVKIKN